MVFQGACTPDRLLVWAYNVNITMRCCPHQPQGKGKVSDVTNQKFGRWLLPLPSAQYFCQQLLCFMQVSVQDFSSQECPFPLFSVWFKSSNYWFSPGFKEAAKKKISVCLLNEAETPQKVRKSFTKLARASAWKQLACFLVSLEGFSTALALIWQQGPFEAADWHMFSVYFLIK